MIRTKVKDLETNKFMFGDLMVYPHKLGFKKFKTASIILGGFEALHMIHKNQIQIKDQILDPREAFWFLMS